MIWKLWRVITFFLHRYYHALQYIASAGWPNIPIFQRLCLNRMQPLTWHSGKCESKSLLGKLSHIWTSNYPLGASRLKSVDEAEEEKNTDHKSQHETLHFDFCVYSGELWQTLVLFSLKYVVKKTDRRCCRKTSGSSHCGRSWHRRGTHPKRTQPGGEIRIEIATYWKIYQLGLLKYFQVAHWEEN